MPPLQGARTKPEEMRDFHMEKAINALMLKGWSEEGSKGGREGDREGRVKIRIKRMRIQKWSLIPKNRSKRKKHCR